MLKAPISSFHIDFNYDQYRDEFSKLLDNSNISELYFENVDCGIEEISSGLYFYGTFTFEKPARLVYVCTSLNAYILPEGNLSELKTRKALLIKTFEDRVKYMEFFNNCRELINEDRTLADKEYVRARSKRNIQK